MYNIFSHFSPFTLLLSLPRLNYFSAPKRILCACCSRSFSNSLHRTIFFSLLDRSCSEPIEDASPSWQREALSSASDFYRRIFNVYLSPLLPLLFPNSHINKPLSSFSTGSIIINGDFSVILGLLPYHVACTAYALVQTRRFDAALKVALLFALPPLFGLCMGLNVAGSVIQASS